MAADLSRAALLLRSGAERDFALSGPQVSLGFESGNDIRIPIPGVSRRHAKITFDGADYWIEDAGSSNGTFLNGVPVLRRERLRHLDVVTLGRRTDLLFVRKSAAPRRTKRRGIRAAWLETIEGPEAGDRREIPRGCITLGRSPSNNVVVDSQLVSKAHASIERSGLQLILTDLQSANGTFVEEKRIVSRVLKDGDAFSLGKARVYRVRIEEGEIETGDVAPAAAIESTSGGLPLDWKTRMEWTPEEKAVFERARRPSAGRTFAQAPVAKTAVAPKATMFKPPSKKESAEEEAVKHPPAAKPAPAPVTAAAPLPPPTSLEPGAPAEPQPAPPTPQAAAPPPPATEAPVAPAVSPHVASDARAEETRVLSMPPLPPPSTGPAPLLLLESPTRSFSLEPGNHEVGRVAGLRVQIDAPGISRQHAVLRVAASGSVVEDLGSRNGTLVNGERISAPRALADGDVVQFGDVTFRVRLPPAVVP